MIASGVLCVGRVYCDLVFTGLDFEPSPGKEVYAENLSLHTGGGAAITAYYLSKLGRTATLCANLPADPFSTTVHSQLGTHVNLKYCSTHSSTDPQVTVVLTGSMDRSFITNRAGQALPANYHDSIEHCRKTNSITHLHIAELATLLDYPDLITQARTAKWTISLDCAWDIDAMKNTDALALIENVDVFLPNRSEFEQLRSIGVTADSAPVTIIKQGSAGAQAVGKVGRVEAPVEETNCVDATGAGDAFNAGFIHNWLKGLPVITCMESGNRCGSIAVGQPGGIGS